MKKRDIAIALGGAVGAAVAVKMLTRPRTVNWEDVRSLVPHSDHSHFVSVDGVRIHFQEFGDAKNPAVILIHGYRSSLFAWRSAAPRLADSGFRTIAVDLVGFGYSSKPHWFEYSIQSQARVISRLMDVLGLGRASIVGSSYGGAIASVLALDYAERVEKLVLADAVINDGPKNHPILRLVSVPVLGEAITPFLADSRALLKSRMHNTLAKPNHHLITEERVENILRPDRAADAHHSLLASARNWHANRVEQDAHLITQPTLIIWGEDDTVTPLSDGYKLHSSIADSKLVVLRDCGHTPQEEKPHMFSKLVADFCHGSKELAAG